MNVGGSKLPFSEAPSFLTSRSPHHVRMASSWPSSRLVATCSYKTNVFLRQSSNMLSWARSCTHMDCRPGSSQLCEGRGTCDCLGCSCSVPYTGEYCQDVHVELDNCFDLATETEIQMCILDEKDRDDEICQECVFDDINRATISCVLIIPESEQPGVDDESEAVIIEFAENNLPGTEYGYIMSCIFSDDDGCIHDYHILYNIDDLVFVAEEQSICPASRSDPLLSIPLWALTIILLGLLLLLGIIILIIIKVVFLLLDFRKFKVTQGVFVTSHNSAYGMVERTEEAEGSGVNEGREVATGTVSHNITMQPNPVYNVMTSDSQEPEYDYIM